MQQYTDSIAFYSSLGLAMSTILFNSVHLFMWALKVQPWDVPTQCRF